jgi:hypothetical protein
MFGDVEKSSFSTHVHNKRVAHEAMRAMHFPLAFLVMPGSPYGEFQHAFCCGLNLYADVLLLTMDKIWIKLDFC